MKATSSLSTSLRACSTPSRTIGIIVCNVIYLSAINAAAIVDRLDVGENSPADEANR